MVHKTDLIQYMSVFQEEMTQESLGIDGRDGC